jgi:hypothetical protein
MNNFSALSLLLAAVLPAQPAAAAPADPARDRAVAAAVQSLPMRFDNAPLGNVARLLSARFSIPISIASNAKAPITGDFTGMDIKESLAECARQAGLAVAALGNAPSDGFLLEPPRPPAPSNEAAAKDADSAGADPGARAALAAAAARRAELLRRRQALLGQQLQASNGVPGP